MIGQRYLLILGFVIASVADVSGFSLTRVGLQPQRSPPNVTPIGVTVQQPIHCFSSTSLMQSALVHMSSESQEPEKIRLRNQLRRLTGFSLTALRTTARAATGISFTAIYASTLAVTGAWIRQTMKVILSIFPTWFRYFLQPFLIMYYAPLFILRNLTGPTRRRAKNTHNHFVDGWKEAVDTADKRTSYWPVHLDKEGNFEKDFQDVDLNEAIAESVEFALEEQESKA